MTTTEKENALTFLALMQATYELATDIDFDAKPFDRPIIKERVWDLTRTINKQIDRVLPLSDCTKEDWDRAAERMLEFFKVGLKLQQLDEVKAQGFDTQLNILLKTYGVDL
jgi:hypothetical protein